MADSIHKNILDGFQDVIQALSLTGLDSDQVYVGWDVDVQKVKFPAVFVSPVGTEQLLPGTNRSEDIGYPIAVMILDRHPIDNPSNMDAAILWRESIRQAFINQRPAAVLSLAPTLVTVRYQPGLIASAAVLPGYELLVQPMAFIAVSRETR